MSLFDILYEPAVFMMQAQSERLKLSDNLIRTDIFVDTGSMKEVKCPECGEFHPIYDKIRRIWKHMNVCLPESYVIANVPKVNCSRCGIKGSMFRGLKVRRPYKSI